MKGGKKRIIIIRVSPYIDTQFFLREATIKSWGKPRMGAMKFLGDGWNLKKRKSTTSIPGLLVAGCLIFNWRKDQVLRQ
ncbi:MAG: hypothetical protein A2W80_15135 [Candidatus Riflebacteria bacterium GWC2_50_8]|nr:MAG: hypothetical protein A2W80_15135 [Candidatus Riflebacteria bacterium GWC2_50_8]